jgi:hypothetical protein
MKTFVIAAAAVALLTAPASAQGIGGGKKKGQGQEHQADKPKKADDKGYNAALSKLPDQKYDPWKGVR